MKRLLLASATLGGLLFASTASAIPTVLDDTLRCGAGNAEHIALTDVTGNAGNPSECWGAFDGNDTGPSGDGYSINGMTYEFVSKINTPGGVEGQDVVVAPFLRPSERRAYRAGDRLLRDVRLE